MVKGFTIQKVMQIRDNTLPYYLGKKFHYTWDDHDLVYYRDDVDDSYYMDVPVNGSKAICLKIDHKARLLVKIDK